LLDPFASHILRALLVLLAPPIAPAPAPSSSRNSNLRSKKSAKWKARQGPMKNLFDETTAGSTPKLSVIPLSFTKLARDLLTSIRAGLGANEVRAMAADKAASPLLQLLIELEAHVGMADEPDSLMDRVLVGMVEFSRGSPCVYC
jgi:nucleolar protein 9